MNALECGEVATKFSWSGPSVHPIKYPFIYADECFPGGCIFILATAGELPGSAVKTETISIDITSIDATIAFTVTSFYFFYLLVIINNIHYPVVFKGNILICKFIVIYKSTYILKYEVRNEPLFFRRVYAELRWLYCYGITKKMFILSLSLCPLVLVLLSFYQRLLPIFPCYK